jgi:hypothetical protein
LSCGPNIRLYTRDDDIVHHSVHVRVGGLHGFIESYDVIACTQHNLRDVICTQALGVVTCVACIAYVLHGKISL